MAKAYNSRDELLNTNWQDKINNASSDEERAIYEKARNDKIATKEYLNSGGKQTQTYNYNKKPDSNMFKPNHSNPNASIRTKQFAGGPGFENKVIGYGDYTYTFDDQGRQIRAVRDGGRSARDVIPMDPSYLKSDAHRKAADAYSRGDLDEVGRQLGAIGQANGGIADKEFEQRLDLAYGPKGQNFYRDKYDAAFGKGAWDDPNHYGATAPAASGAPGASGGAPAVKQPSTPAEYIQMLYNQRRESEQAALKAAYDAKLSKLKGAAENIGNDYADQRGILQGQNALKRMQMNELGIAQGLNTGANGQLALGNSQAYIGALGALAQREMQDRAAAQRAEADLLSEYYSGLNKSNAATNADLLNALYADYIRREDQKREDAKLEEDKRRWQLEFDAANRARSQSAYLEQQKLLASLGLLGGDNDADTGDDGDSVSVTEPGYQPPSAPARSSFSVSVFDQLMNFDQDAALKYVNSKRNAMSDADYEYVTRFMN